MTYSPDDLPEDEGDTRSTRPPSRPARRRRMPADDLPRADDRPSLSRRSRSDPPPYIPPPPVTPPVTGSPYDLPQGGRSKRDRRSTAPGRPPVSKRDSGLYLPWWSLVIMLAFVGCAAVGALLIVNSMGGSAAVGGLTPQVIVITSTFTVGAPTTQTPIPQPATLTPTKPLPTVPPTASLPPGNFAIGETVKVVGVGTNGLNVRSGPGTGAAVKFRASDNETYVLKDGPQSASSEEWWFIQDPNNPDRGGWASRRFLTAISTGGGTPAAQ
jgi:hypothetical protein